MTRAPAAIGPGEVHVWFASVPALASHKQALIATLNGPERARARLEPRHLVARGVLRLLLGRYLSMPPCEVPVRQRCPECGGPHGPLEVPGMSASVSYAADRVAFSFARGPVGIDVEALCPGFRWQPAARLVLPASVVARISALPPPDQQLAFLRAWTAREAVGKAVGVGIAAERGELDRAASAAAARWTILPLAAGARHVVTVAAAGASTRVRKRGWVRAIAS